MLSITGSTSPHYQIHVHVITMYCFLSSHGRVIMQTEYGETALHTASRFGHVNVITALVEKGADVNCLTKVGGVHSSIVEDGMLSL